MPSLAYRPVLLELRACLPVWDGRLVVKDAKCSCGQVENICAQAMVVIKVNIVNTVNISQSIMPCTCESFDGYSFSKHTGQAGREDYSSQLAFQKLEGRQDYTRYSF